MDTSRDLQSQLASDLRGPLSMKAEGEQIDEDEGPEMLGREAGEPVAGGDDQRREGVERLSKKAVS